MPPDLERLRQLFRQRNYLLTQHASSRAVSRAITCSDIEAAIANGEVIEDYPEDKYGPGCLILGRTEAGRAIHVQVSYDEGIKVITVYEPSPERWENDLKTRKS